MRKEDGGDHTERRGGERARSTVSAGEREIQPFGIRSKSVGLTERAGGRWGGSGRGLLEIHTRMLFQTDTRTLSARTLARSGPTHTHRRATSRQKLEVTVAKCCSLARSSPDCGHLKLNSIECAHGELLNTNPKICSACPNCSSLLPALSRQINTNLERWLVDWERPERTEFPEPKGARTLFCAAFNTFSLSLSLDVVCRAYEHHHVGHLAARGPLY